MGGHQIKQVLRDLEDANSSLSAIAREHGCSPSFASRALRAADMPIGARKAGQIREAIAAKLGRDPWADDGATSGV